MVEAVQLDEHNSEEIAEWCRGTSVSVIKKEGRKFNGVLMTVKDRSRRPREVTAKPGDWIIRRGSSFYPYGSKQFEEQYQDYAELCAKQYDEVLELVRTAIKKQDPELYAMKITGDIVNVFRSKGE